MPRTPEEQPVNRQRKGQDPRYTPDGHLTNWGYMLRVMEAIRADRSMDIGPFGSGMQQALESPRGQQIAADVTAMAVRDGLIKPATDEERSEARLRRHIERTQASFQDETRAQ